MKLLGNRNLKSALFLFVIVAFFFGLSNLNVKLRAQDRAQLPARTGYVNDFAGVLDEGTKRRLEAILENVKQRSGIELNVNRLPTIVAFPTRKRWLSSLAI